MVMYSHCDNAIVFLDTITRCGCANSMETVTINGESKGCDRPCSGDDSEMCGGLGAVTAWKV